MKYQSHLVRQNTFKVKIIGELNGYTESYNKTFDSNSNIPNSIAITLENCPFENVNQIEVYHPIEKF